MESIKNTLAFLEANWVGVLICISLLVSIYKKTKDYLSKSDEEKIEIAKKYISEAILKMITDAEKDYEDWNKAGSIKRSQVIKQIFADYPILEKVADQEELVKWIDSQIDDALKTLRQIIKENTPVETNE